MTSFFLVKNKFTHAVVAGICFLGTFVFYCFFNTKYIFDIYSLNDKIKEYEHPNDQVTELEITKWR